MALIANCNRDKKRRPIPYRANDFNPTRRRRTNMMNDYTHRWLAEASDYVDLD